MTGRHPHIPAIRLPLMLIHTWQRVEAATTVAVNLCGQSRLSIICFCVSHLYRRTRFYRSPQLVGSLRWCLWCRLPNVHFICGLLYAISLRFNFTLATHSDCKWVCQDNDGAPNNNSRAGHIAPNGLVNSLCRCQITDNPEWDEWVLISGSSTLMVSIWLRGFC